MRYVKVGGGALAEWRNHKRTNSRLRFSRLDRLNLGWSYHRRGGLDVSSSAVRPTGGTGDSGAADCLRFRDHTPRGRGEEPCPWPQTVSGQKATRKQVVEMYSKGAKLKHIQTATGVPISTIFHILKEAGQAPQRMTRRKLEPTSQTDQVSNPGVVDPLATVRASDRERSAAGHPRGVLNRPSDGRDRQ